jgi:hypothetical protein
VRNEEGEVRQDFPLSPFPFQKISCHHVKRVSPDTTPTDYIFLLL